MLSYSTNGDDLTGTYGLERRREILQKSNQKMDDNNFLTTTRQSFDYQVKLLEKEKEKNKFIKFKTLQDKGSALATMLKPEKTEIKEQNGKKSLSLTSSFSRSGLNSTLNDSMEVNLSRKLDKTYHRMLHTSDAPVAIGRSGTRREQGLTTSGLAGERLMFSLDPRSNSLAQRSWLYYDDPALKYKLNGVPQSEPPTYLSLDIKDHTAEEFKGWNYGRRAILTGGILTKTGTLRAGIFLDDHDQDRIFHHAER